MVIRRRCDGWVEIIVILWSFGDVGTDCETLLNVLQK